MRTRPLNPKNEYDVQVSQSALEAFFQCPARMDFMTRWERTPTPMILADGIDAHRILAGEEVPDASQSAVAFAENLWDLKEENGIELFSQEHEQVFELEDGIWFKRIIDGIGYWQGEPVLIDWKTSIKGPWAFFRNGRSRIVPKSMTFQAVSYLIPPPEDELERLGIPAWPEQILFLVSNATGQGDICAYTRNAEDEENFRKACRLYAEAVRKAYFPRVRGNVCGIPNTSWACNYLELCYQLPGWEQKFRQVKGEGETEDV